MYLFCSMWVSDCVWVCVWVIPEDRKVWTWIFLVPCDQHPAVSGKVFTRPDWIYILLAPAFLLHRLRTQLDIKHSQRNLHLKSADDQNKENRLKAKFKKKVKTNANLARFYHILKLLIPKLSIHEDLFSSTLRSWSLAIE